MKNTGFYTRDRIRTRDDADLGDLAAGNNLLHGETEAGLLRVRKKSFKGHKVGKLLIPRLIQQETHRLIFTTSWDCAGINMKPMIIKISTHPLPAFPQLQSSVHGVCLLVWRLFFLFWEKQLGFSLPERLTVRALFYILTSLLFFQLNQLQT